MTATSQSTAISSVNAQQLLAEAIQLQQTFSEVDQTIGTQPPSEQLNILQSLTWNTGETLRQLQTKVENFFSAAEIDAKCVEISDKLSDSVQIMERLGNTQDQLFVYTDLFSDAQSALQSKRMDVLSSLQQRVTSEIRKNNNQGLQNALLHLQSNLREALGVQNPIVTTNATQDKSAPTLPSQVVSSVSQKIEELNSKYCELSGRNQDFKPEETYRVFLPFFTDLHDFSQNPSFSQDKSFSQLYSLVSGRLENAYKSQVEMEHREQVSRAATASTSAENFASALAKANAEVNSTNFDGLAHARVIRETFDKLSDQEKQKFYHEFIKIKKLPVSILKRSIDLWPGTIKEKFQAAAKAFPSPSGAASQSNTMKRSDQMKRSYDEVLMKVSRPIQQPQSHQSIPQSIASVPTNRNQVPNNFGVFFNVIQPADQIQKGIHLLLKNQQGSLAATIRILKGIANANVTCVLAMSGNQPIAVDTRPYFHLYHIHRNESPSLLRDDMDYGSKAFAGIDGFTATDTERVRSLQRALVEIYLTGIEDAINFGYSDSMKVFMDLLENIPLQSSDLPHSTTNVAHALFGAFYQLHSEAKNNNPSLIDPNLTQFEGDFGRNAFISFTTGIDNSIKHQTVVRVRNSLKAAWRI